MHCENLLQLGIHAEGNISDIILFVLVYDFSQTVIVMACTVFGTLKSEICFREC